MRESGTKWPPGGCTPEGLTDTGIGGIGMGERICSREGCEKRQKARGLCAAHYRTAQLAGEFTPRPYNRTGRRVAKSGYAYVWQPDHPLAHADGYVAEHRKVVFDAGIAVPAGWHVHHRNGDKSDNRLENLEVTDASAHHREHNAPGSVITNQFGQFVRLPPEQYAEHSRELQRKYRRQRREAR